MRCKLCVQGFPSKQIYIWNVYIFQSITSTSYLNFCCFFNLTQFVRLFLTIMNWRSMTFFGPCAIKIFQPTNQPAYDESVKWNRILTCVWTAPVIITGLFHLLTVVSSVASFTEPKLWCWGNAKKKEIEM